MPASRSFWSESKRIKILEIINKMYLKTLYLVNEWEKTKTPSWVYKYLRKCDVFAITSCVKEGGRGVSKLDNFSVWTDY